MRERFESFPTSEDMGAFLRAFRGKINKIGQFLGDRFENKGKNVLQKIQRLG